MPNVYAGRAATGMQRSPGCGTSCLIPSPGHCAALLFIYLSKERDAKPTHSSSTLSNLTCQSSERKGRVPSLPRGLFNFICSAHPSWGWWPRWLPPCHPQVPNRENGDITRGWRSHTSWGLCGNIVSKIGGENRGQDARFPQFREAHTGAAGGINVQ